MLMATRLGASALGLGHLTGSLEPGKRADLIVVDLDPLHNTPQFTRDPDAVYARLVYAGKSTDVTDTMCNGRWLMRDRHLLTLDGGELALGAREYARRIDAFLIAREESVLQKLIAIGGAREEESFEVQVKAPLSSDESVLEFLAGSDITVIKSVRYHQYDTYFSFADPSHGRLRFREDEILDEKDNVTRVRARLTLIGPASEAELGSVLLFRSRFLAPANQSRRFYREYFRPTSERDVDKQRRRWLVAYRGVEFYVHLDKHTQPPLPGYFLEIKSRTWSRRDAMDKAVVITELMQKLGAAPAEAFGDGYVDFEVPGPA
jgi:5-methylthioadenosine/S-adenosylhomocysteine deaminase